MTRLVHHIRSNVIAYLALFIALGGTSYAAISVPRNSVGAPQIRNHSITAVKLNQKSIAASVRAWARIIVDPFGKTVLQASDPRATVTPTSFGEVLQWRHHSFPSGCFVGATSGAQYAQPGFVSADFDPTATGGAQVKIFSFTPNGTASPRSANVVVICP